MTTNEINSVKSCDAVITYSCNSHVNNIILKNLKIKYINIILRLF
jgi:hypothetical protein